MKKLLTLSLLGFTFAYATIHANPEEQLNKVHEKIKKTLRQRISHDKVFEKQHPQEITTRLPFALGLNSTWNLLGVNGPLLRSRGLGNGMDMTPQLTVLTGVLGAALFGWMLNNTDDQYNKTVATVVKAQEEEKLVRQLEAFQELAISALSAEQDANRVLLQQFVKDNESIQKQTKALKGFKESLNATHDTTLAEDPEEMLDTCLNAAQTAKRTLEGALTALQKQ